MNKVGQLEYLKSAGVIASDSEIISDHNNLIVSSEFENTVSRISSLDIIKNRSDPGNLIYAHHLSRDIGSRGSVLPPIDDDPIEFEGNIVSRFPRMRTPDWESVSATSLSETVLNLNNFPYSTACRSVPIRKLDVASYAQHRLNSVIKSYESNIVDASRNLLNYYRENYNFHAATIQNEGLIHGDLHAGNIMLSETGDKLLFIDLDSIAIGPKEYDLASWCVRSMRGDKAPAIEATAIAIGNGELSLDAVRTMIGWKALSSITHEFAYNPNNPETQIIELVTIARKLDAPGPWDLYE